MKRAEGAPPIDLSQRYTIREAAAYLRQSIPKTYEQINDGRLETFMEGRRRYATGRGIVALSTGGPVAAPDANTHRPTEAAQITIERLKAEKAAMVMQRDEWRGRAERLRIQLMDIRNQINRLLAS